MAKTMKLTLTLLILAALAALPLAAATFDTSKFAQTAGVQLDGGAKVNIEEGRTLTAKVVSAAALAKLGLKGARNGEAVQVTWHGKNSFSFLHVPSGRKLESVEVGTSDYFSD
jgi:hypothetical protein